LLHAPRVLRPSAVHLCRINQASGQAEIEDHDCQGPQSPPN